MTTAQAPKQIDYDDPNSILSHGKSSTNQSSKRKLDPSSTIGRTSSTQNLKQKSYFETLEMANRDKSPDGMSIFAEPAHQLKHLLKQIKYPANIKSKE